LVERQSGGTGDVDKSRMEMTLGIAAWEDTGGEGAGEGVEMEEDFRGGNDLGIKVGATEVEDIGIVRSVVNTSVGGIILVSKWDSLKRMSRLRIIFWEVGSQQQ
jgi:hypothetical protein